MEEPWVEFVFWFSLLALGYTYVGYPFVLWVWARIGPCQVSHASKESIVPSVSIVIAARNEAARLATRIENCLTQRYPPDRLHVIVVSDGSTDQTEEVVGRFDPARVTLVILKESQGKAGALNAGVARSESEIIVFADARQRFGLSAVEELVRNFADPSVGAVSGELILHSPVEGPGAEAVGVYWAIEKWIRRAEGAIDSVIGTTGAIYAIRRTLYEPLPSGAILDDLLVPMRIAMRGSRVVFEPRARAFDWIEQDYHAEFTRKVRTLAGNYQAISLCPDLIKPWRNRLFLQFVSHKVCRLASPFWLGVLFLSNLLLLEGWLRYLFALQLTGYGMAAIGWGLSRAGVRERWTAGAFMFCLLNYAAFVAAIKCCGGATALWQTPGTAQPRQRRALSKIGGAAP